MEVIEAFQSGQMSQRQVTRKYGVHRTTIVTWEKKYGNPEKNYLRMEEKTPQQELAELRAALKAANEENKTLKYVMRVIQEEYGEGLVKKYLPGLQLKKPQTKIKKSK
jgi:transposase